MQELWGADMIAHWNDQLEACCDLKYFFDLWELFYLAGLEMGYTHEQLESYRALLG